MPRPGDFRALPGLLAAIGLLLAVASPAGQSAVAAAGSTIFEATVVVAGGALLGRASGRIAAFLTCGCGGAWPPALALAPFVLTWWTFGPGVAAARSAVALLIGLRGARGAARRPAEPPDPLADLGALAVASFAAALLAATLRAHAVPAAAPFGSLALAVGAAVLGTIAPCATAGIAAAASLKATAPLATAAILATCGLVRLRMPLQAPSRTRPSRPSWIALGVVLAALTLHGVHGFVNPRFAFVAPLGALCALALAMRGGETRARLPALPALIAAGALVFAGAPAGIVASAVPLNVYPGERVEFTGYVSSRSGTGTSLVRYAIACCRADAQPLGIEVDRRLDARLGTWVEARGIVARRDDRFVLHADRVRPVAPPADPFMYL
ncbi:MAG: hypothetical protein GIW95_05290 [Candidatus Eremiobacteraeota bacterium]|nr:hypothetical protein [Candidatus Eremiobacteraeota bacterium]